MAAAVWTPVAEDDLERIYEWIAHRDGRRRTAKDAIRALRARCEEYAMAFASGSVIGTARPTFGKGYRVFTHQRWVVVFRPAVDGIEVMRVVDGSRDYSRLFRE
jgi:plasmid stabilization system protein ParE